MLRTLLAQLLLFSSLLLQSQVYDFNTQCRSAYTKLLQLKLQEGEALLQAEEKRDPSNLIPIYLENYVDFLRIYAADTYGQYSALRKNKDVRLAQLTNGSVESPYYLFTQAEVNLQWAALDIKFGEHLSAVFEIRKAFKLLEENERKYPDFKPNRKSLGVLYALLGSVPDKYKWGLKLLGMEGNVELGIGYLRELVNYGKHNDYIYHEETVTYYAFLLQHLQNQSELAWQVLIENGFPKDDNLMTLYSCAHIGIYGKHTEEALKILREKASDTTFASLPELFYLTGLAKLNKLETDPESYFKQFIAVYKGENHIKSAFQKIAWSYLLKGDTSNYHHFIRKADKLGASILDIDKQAQREAQSKQVPDINLLRARLLFDGGYYQKAANEMSNLSELNFKTIDLQTEYLYRTGRIYDEWNKPDSALVFYAKTIDKGKELPRFFAAKAALESGKIYERTGDKEKAKYYYNLCLGFEDHEYKNGLDQLAKAGLNRLR